MTWEPGDAKKVTYALYRNGDLLEEPASTYYLDTDLEWGEDYDYRLVVRHFRAEGPPASLRVYIVPPMVAVPDVTNMTVLDAERAIKEARFRFGGVSRDEFHATVPDGSVISTLPAAPGTMAAAGSVVTVVMSDGPAPVSKPIPDLAGMPDRSEQTVRAALAVLGFIISTDVLQEHSAYIPAGQVIRTVPPAKTLHPVNVPLQLIVSKGPAQG